MRTNHFIHLKESKHRQGEGIELHHHQTYQILYVLENKGKITLNDEIFTISQDEVALITPYSKHSIFTNTKVTLLVLEFHKSSLDEEIQEGLLDLYFSSSHLLTLNVIEAGEMRQLLRKMLYEQSIGQSINKLALKIHLSELLLILAKAKEETRMVDANTLRAERLRRYIDTHYFEMIDANYIAHLLGMSIRHINTIFKEHYHKTPIQYLNEVRMERSKKMLIETDKDIVSICFEVGFESLSTFYRSFKKYTHMSPNQYRKKYREPEINFKNR